MRIIISSLLFILSSSFIKKDDVFIADTVWRIEKIEIKAIKYEFDTTTDSCFIIKFSKNKKKKFGYIGDFLIYSEVKNKASFFHVQPPYEGFYLLPDIKTNIIKLGWKNNRSYNPNFIEKEIGKIIREAFSMNKGIMQFDNDKLIISSEDGGIITLVKR